MSISKILEPLTRVAPMYPGWALEEDGYDLWLRYRLLEGASRSHVASRARSIVVPDKPSVTMLAALAELHRGLTGMLGRAPAVAKRAADGAIVLATPASMPKLASLGLPLDKLG